MGNMEITEVRIKLIDNPGDRLRGFCSITFDDSFVVRDLKIIEGNSGPFVAMPSRKLTDNCQKCRSKNHLRANFCNQCGAQLHHAKIEQDPGGRAKLYADVAHPVNAQSREMIQNRVVQEFDRELALAAQPGYQPRYDDDYFDDDPGPKANSTSAVAGSNDGAQSNEPEPQMSIRIDSADKKPYKTHNRPAEVNEQANSSDGDFGKGVFE